MRLMAADNFIETARPPASSEASEIREPLDKRARLFWRSVWLRLRFSEDRLAEVFVLIVMPIIMLIHSDFRVATRAVVCCKQPCRGLRPYMFSE